MPVTPWVMIAQNPELQVPGWAGDRALLRAIATEEERVFLEQGGSPTIVVFHFALAGEDEKTATWLERAFDVDDAILVSPMYFLPEDWEGLERSQRALDKEGLRELYDLRRMHIAAGTGRGTRQP